MQKNLIIIIAIAGLWVLSFPQSLRAEKNDITVIQDVLLLERNKQQTTLALLASSLPVYCLQTSSYNFIKLEFTNVEIVPGFKNSINNHHLGDLITFNSSNNADSLTFLLNLKFDHNISEIRFAWLEKQKVLILMFRKSFQKHENNLSAHEQIKLKKVRFGPWKKHTRIVMDLSSKPLWRWSGISSNQSELMLQHCFSTTVKDKWQNIRRIEELSLKSEQFEHVKIDITHNASLKFGRIFWLDTGNRLVIDILDSPKTLYLPPVNKAYTENENDIIQRMEVQNIKKDNSRSRDKISKDCSDQNLGEKQNSQTEPLSFAFKGYVKNIFGTSKSMNNEQFVSNLLRLRLDLESSYRNHLWRVIYDQEVIISDSSRNSESYSNPSDRYDDFFDLDWNISNSRHLTWDHRLYRAYWKTSFSSSDIVLGRQRIAWGTGKLWNPTDLFNPTDPLQLEQDEKVGVDAVDFTWYPDSLLSCDIVYAPDTSQDNSSLAVRIKKTVDDWDMSLMGGYFRENTIIGGSFSTTFLEGGLWGELTHTWLNDDSQQHRRDNFFQLVMGYDYTFLNSLYLMVEYFHNDGNMTNGIFSLVDLIDSEQLTTYEKDFIGCCLGYDITPLIRSEITSIWDINGNSCFVWPQINWSILQDFELEFGAQLYGGNTPSEFGEFNNLYYFQMKYFF